MQSQTSVFLVLLALVLPAFGQPYYVAPAGHDANPGTLEKPFGTIERAQQAVREKKGTVFLRGGTYYLRQPLVFSARDSGTKDAPVIFQAYQDEHPVISGGVRLDNLQWQPTTGGVFKTTVAADLSTEEIFVNGERQILARYPNFDPSAQYFDGFAADAISTHRVARWADPAGGYFHAMHPSLWGDFTWRITGKNAQGGVTLEGGWQNNRGGAAHETIRFVENIFEELDAPGEWFLEAKTHTLYYYPPSGLDLPKATLEATRLRSLVEFRGSDENPVRFITLRGLTFRHAARTVMDTKEPLMRSDWAIYRGGAIFFEGAEDCALEDSFLDQLGGNAVFVNQYNRRIVVCGCHIARAGASGVCFIGDPRAARNPLFNYSEVNRLDNLDRTPGPRTDNYPADCLVEDCLIYLTGRVEKQTAGVAIDLAQDITVRHCSIYDTPRAGINIGDGCWGGHVVEFCDVFDTVKETGDHGSFNSWGRDRYWRPNIDEVNAWVRQVPELPRLDAVKPTILRHNRWRCDHGWDIDLDDGSSFYVITNNLCLHGGIKNREGYGRVVENNILVGAGFHPHVWLAESGDLFQRNIVWLDYLPALMYAPPWGRDLDYNLVHKDGALPTPAARLQQQSGRDEHSLVADARFIDPAKGDYRVADGSPALSLGFVNFPMDQFGVRKPALKAIARTPLLPGAIVFSPGLPAAGPGQNNSVSAAAIEPYMRKAFMHDPSTLIRCKEEFWVFASGRGVPSWHSKDLANWERGPAVFASNPPPWVAEAVPANRALSFWAPDVTYLNGRYLLYYSASSFGKNTSGIGLVTSPTLDPSDPAYGWKDQGMIIASTATDDFNAIDPAIFHDANGSLWLTFGSFWSGIKMIQLDPRTGKRLDPGSPMLSLAHYDSIEASYLYQHAGDYFLFVNWGLCCRGTNSTYSIHVGRSRSIVGPYLDREGKDMLHGGGTLFLDTTKPYVGPGHAGIFVDRGTNWFSCHYEAGPDTGVPGQRRASPLAILPLRWTKDNWPELDLK